MSCRVPAVDFLKPSRSYFFVAQSEIRVTVKQMQEKAQRELAELSDQVNISDANGQKPNKFYDG